MPPDPLILAFDTAAAHCAAALVSGGAIVAERHERMARGQAERLFGILEDLLREGGVGWHDLARLGVGTGPGNFTGIRISVAAARGLALSLGIPAIGVSGFEVLAEGAPRPLLALIDGRAGRLHAQRFGPAGPAPAFSTTAGELQGGPGNTEITYCGHHARELAAAHGAAWHPAPASPAPAIARIAARAAADSPRPAPFYMRPADAAPPREDAPKLLP